MWTDHRVALHARLRMERQGSSRRPDALAYITCNLVVEIRDEITTESSPELGAP